ncbi:MAG: hypothetical protein J6Y08_01450 [Clostridiales bacterium]|nr:hypothetical protein [Clostridiales bacterium]
MKKRMISICLAAALIASMTAGCKKASKETNKKNKTGSRTDTETTSEDLEGMPDPDQVILSSEYYNYAWGESAIIKVVMGDGRVYAFTNKITALNRQNTTDREKSLRAKIELLNRIDAQVTAKDIKDYREELMRIYEEASQVDPNAPQTDESYMRDFGVKSLYYWNEEGERVLCYRYGDISTTIDDQHVSNMMEFLTEDSVWGDILLYGGMSCMDLYSKIDMPIETYHCGYVELPQDSTGRYLFRNYNDFKVFADENHLDISDMDIFQVLEDDYPIFVQFDIVSSTGYNRNYDGWVMDHNTCYFVPGKDYSDPKPGSVVGQAMDGFVTICVFTGTVDLSVNTYTDVDGQYWQVYERQYGG